METTKEIPLHPFLFVGCWNNPTTKDYVGVFKKISEDPITTLILGGDNIYPKKNPNGSKEYSVDEVENGFEIARQGKNVVLTALGNHNIGNKDVYDKIKELYAIESNYYCVHFSDGFSLVFLDTSLCKKGGEQMEAMFAWLADLLGRIGPYYLVQHVPIASIRDDGPDLLRRKNELLKIIQHNLPRAILCAHTHLYQHGKIEFQSSPHNESERASPNLGLAKKEIDQFIVGTGGAILDGSPSHDDTSIAEGNFFSYTILETQKTHGYARIMAPGAFEFVPLKLEAKGGYRKTRSRRRLGRSRRSKKQGKRA